MGHMYPEEIAKLTQEMLVEKTAISANDIVKEAIKRDIGVSCAEGVYREQYMYEMAVWSLLHIYQEYRQIKFITKTERQKRALDLWLDGELADAWDGSGSLYWSRKLMDCLPFVFNDGVTELTIITYIEH